MLSRMRSVNYIDIDTLHGHNLRFCSTEDYSLSPIPYPLFPNLKLCPCEVELIILIFSCLKFMAHLAHRRAKIEAIFTIAEIVPQHLMPPSAIDLAAG